MDKMTVLYIDDEEGDGVLMQIHMADRGIDVDVCRYGISGAEIFNPARHALAIIDWNLLDITGAETARRIRQKHPQANIIFLSACYTDERLMEALSFRPLACLEKNTSMAYMEAIARLIQEQLCAA